MRRHSPTMRRPKITSAADVSAQVKRTSDRPVQKIGQGIQGNRHDIKAGSGMGIK